MQDASIPLLMPKLPFLQFYKVELKKYCGLFYKKTFYLNYNEN